MTAVNEPAVMTLPDLTAALTRYRAGLKDLTDAGLQRRAAEVAALPGWYADELRCLVDAERESRRTATPPATPPARSRVLRVAAGAAVTGAPAAALTGRALAQYAEQVPQVLLYSPAVAVGLVAAAVGGSWVARWVDDHRHPLAEDVDEADLNPLGVELLARVRAARQARGEVC
ncbi:hypothetical protein GA0070622_6424 [Micromonospora sediminicola]|uniref:Uncharacterized protein n=1 Tax=Micromonospora sediminicola TaxID=946078 RepID=A0A1A9BIG2_9ACTN|nr:hypothetical protein [Micromonospora sediminicola]SBT69300.1 hypothetical protein GA0070622_6424 [Micromonospora sediminicola]